MVIGKLNNFSLLDAIIIIEISFLKSLDNRIQVENSQNQEQNVGVKWHKTENCSLEDAFCKILFRHSQQNMKLLM